MTPGATELAPYAAICVFAITGAWVRIQHAKGTTSDAWVSDWIIQRNVGKPWMSFVPKDSVIDGTHGYPALVQWIVAKFPRSQWDRIGALISSMADLGTALAVSALVATQVGWGSLATWATFAIAWTTPAWHPPTARLTATKGRAIGCFFTTIFFLSIVQIRQSSDSGEVGIWALIGLCCVYLVVWSSQFAMQVIALVPLVAMPLLPHWWMGLLGLAGLSIAVLVPIGGSRHIALRWFHHKLWYSSSRRSQTTATSKDRFMDYVRWPATIVRRPKVGLKQAVRHLTLIGGPLMSPALILLPWSFRSNSLILDVALPWTVGAIGATLITMIPFLRIIGQAERYLEYAVPWASMAVAWTIHDGNLPQSTLLLLLFSNLLIAILLYYGFAARKDSGPALKEIDAVVNWFANHGSARVLCVPIKASALFSERMQARRLQGTKFVFGFMQTPGDRGFATLQTQMNGPGTGGPDFQIPAWSPKTWHQELGITHVVTWQGRTGRLQDALDWKDTLANSTFATRTFTIHTIATSGS